MPEFEKSKGFKMKGPTFFKEAWQKSNKIKASSPAKQMGMQAPMGNVPPPPQAPGLPPTPTMYSEDSPVNKGKAGKVIGGILTGGVSNVIGAIRKKRKAKKAAKKAGAPAAESPAKKGKAGKVIGGILTGGVSNVIGAIRKKRKAKKAAKKGKAPAAGQLGGAAPTKKGKAGKVIGNILTGGVSGVIGKIRAKRKAKKAAKAGPAGPAGGEAKAAK